MSSTRPHPYRPEPELTSRDDARAHYRAVRHSSNSLAAPLSAEDAQIQSMPDASPAKWHLAHTSWFFESFILASFDPDYRVFDADFAYLFNSYYEAKGPRHARPERGLITRPGLERVMDYRKYVDEHMIGLVDRIADHADWHRLAALLELGLHHEQQHQELLLSDIKHALSLNPLQPAYKASYPKPVSMAHRLEFQTIDEGLYQLGHRGAGFGFDNEFPAHQVRLDAFQLASRTVTNADYLHFIEDGGYHTASLWLSDGWDYIRREQIDAPLYWSSGDDGERFVFSLYGRQPINREEPVCHLSYYEADAFATWAGARLPSEAELEVAALTLAPPGTVNDLASGRLHPATVEGPAFSDVAGNVWEWTRSAYLPYPGFRQADGAVGEYNGKFMINQMVVRGGSCATPAGHWRASYRNFFYPHQRWQFFGLRLARDV